METQGGRDPYEMRDNNYTCKQRSLDNPREYLPALRREKTAKTCKLEVIPVSDGSTMSNLAPSVEVGLRRLLQEGPTVMSILKSELRPSTPPLIMCLGEVDCCIKPQRPDGVQDTLGLTVIDEPVGLLTNENMRLLRTRNYLPSMKDTELTNGASLASHHQNSHTLRQEVEAWVNAVKVHHTATASCAKAAGLESTSLDLIAHIECPLCPQLNCALHRQFLFCISELPALSLSVENLAKVVCWLAGVPSTQSVTSPLPELLALFSFCHQKRPIVTNKAIGKLTPASFLL